MLHVAGPKERRLARCTIQLSRLAPTCLDLPRPATVCTEMRVTACLLLMSVCLSVDGECSFGLKPEESEIRSGGEGEAQRHDGELMWQK